MCFEYKYSIFKNIVDNFSKKLNVSPPDIFLFNGNYFGLYVGEEDLIGFNIHLETSQTKEVEYIVLHELLHYVGIDHGVNYDNVDFYLKMYEFLGDDWFDIKTQMYEKYSKIIGDLCPLVKNKNIIEVLYLKENRVNFFKKLYVLE